MKTLLATLLLLCHYGIATHSHAQASFFDPTFGVGGKTIVPVAPTSSGMFFAVGVQPDGKIIASGIVAGKAVLVRYKDNGTPDSSFATNGYFVPDIPSAIPTIFYDFAIQSDGKIVAVGNIPTPRFPAYKSDFLAIRLNTDGSVDGSFGVAGQSIVTFGADNHEAKGVAVQADGKIVIVGSAQSSRLGLTRLNANGQIDSAFGINGTVLAMVCHAEDVDITSDGKIVVGGHASAAQQYALLAVRYLPNGLLDTSFNHTGIVYTIAGEPRSNIGKSIKIQTDGKILLAGTGTFVDGGNNFTVVRFLTNGSLDNSFGIDGISTIDFENSDEYLWDIWLRADGKLLLFGSSETSEGKQIATAQLNGDGTPDMSFGIGARIINYVSNVSDAAMSGCIQADDKIIVVGNTLRTGTMYNPFIARLLPFVTFVITFKEEIEGNILLWPNPANGFVRVTAEHMENIESIRLISFEGKQIDIDNRYSNGKIDLLNLTSGQYFVIIRYNGSEVIKSICVY